MDPSKNLKLEVKAIDSCGNSTAVSKTVQILDWVLPLIDLSAGRINNEDLFGGVWEQIQNTNSYPSVFMWKRTD